MSIYALNHQPFDKVMIRKPAVFQLESIEAVLPSEYELAQSGGGPLGRSSMDEHGYYVIHLQYGDWKPSIIQCVVIFLLC